MKGRLLLVCLSLFASAALPAREIRLGEESQIEVGGQAEELRGPATIEEARASGAWRQLSGKSPNYGFTRDIIWLRLSVSVDRAAERILYLDGWCDHFDVFVTQGGITRQYDLGLQARLDEEGKRYRRIFLPLTFQPGTTELLFRMQSTDTLRFPLEIFTRSHFDRFRDISILLFALYFGGMIIMAVYNLFLYAITKDRSYRTYVLFVLFAVMYFSSQQGFLLQFAPDLGQYVIGRMNIIAGALYLAGMLAFASDFLGLFSYRRLFTINRALLVCALLASAAGAIPSFRYSTVAAALSYISLMGLLLCVLSGIFVWRKGYSPARYYLLAFTVFVLGAVFYIFGILGVLPFNFLTAHGIQLGSVGEVTLFAIALSDRISVLNRTVRAQMKELESAHELLATSEHKYRKIVEDTGDLVFSLDPEGKITSMNRSALRNLGHRPEHLIGLPFDQLIFQRPEVSAGFETLMFRDAFAALNSSPFQMRMLLTTRHGEPVQFQIRVEKIGEGEHALILGKGTPVGEDVLLKFLETDKESYYIDNYLTTSELLNQRATRNLYRYFDDSEVADVQLVLREMLINAIEHGNLEVDFDTKTAAQREGDYLAFLQERQKLPRYQGRRVRLQYGLNAHRVWYRITDEGPGFDHKKTVAESESRLSDPSRSHGRGIAIARRLFDVVVYNEKGNQVTMVKFARKKSV